MERDGGLTLERVLTAIERHRAACVVTFTVAAALGSVAAMKIPPTYRASVIMTIEPGRYPNDFLRPNVIPGLDSRLASLEHLLESAPVIEELRKRGGIDKETEDKSPEPGILESLGLARDPIESFRKAFTFEELKSQTQRKDEAVVVEIAFKHHDPETAARVVNAAAMRANEENLRFRRAFVEEVVRFLEKAIKRAEEDYRAKEAAWNSFKLKNADRLPDQEVSILARLGQLRTRYTDLKATERFVENRVEQLVAERGLLVHQMALGVELLLGRGEATGTSYDPTDLRSERLKLLQDRDGLERALRRYELEFTERNPTVKLTRAELEDTEKRLKELDAKLGALGMPLEPTKSPAAGVDAGASSAPGAPAHAPGPAGGAAPPTPPPPAGPGGADHPIAPAPPLPPVPAPPPAPPSKPEAPKPELPAPARPDAPKADAPAKTEAPRPETPASPSAKPDDSVAPPPVAPPAPLPPPPRDPSRFEVDPTKPPQPSQTSQPARHGLGERGHLLPTGPNSDPKKRTRSPSTPETPKLEGDDARKPAAPAAPAPPALPPPPALGTPTEPPLPRLGSRIVLMPKLVEVLSIPKVDEKACEKALDPTIYRAVIAHPSFGRIRAIDFALDESREGLTGATREKETTYSEIRKLEDALAAIPEIRQRIESLARELIEAREDYLRLANQRDNALKALDVENEGKGEQFRVIEFARPPVRPSGPGPILFLGVAVALAAGASVGVCLLLQRRADRRQAAPAPETAGASA